MNGYKSKSLAKFTRKFPIISSLIYVRMSSASEKILSKSFFYVACTVDYQNQLKRDEFTAVLSHERIKPTSKRVRLL